MAIEAIFKRPFDEQVAFFRGKLGNLIPTERWTDVWKSAHDTGFMVAGAAKADLLADLAGAVERGIVDGVGIDAFRKDFDAIVEKHGWSYRGEYNWRTRTIYRTNMATSYSAGRLVQLKDAGFEYWIYRHSDSVARPRPLHVSWDGLTLPADDPWWSSHYPPNGWNCFPAETEIRCDAVLGLKTWYTGEMVELHSALGHRLTVTANHPILTIRGWVAAHLVKEGDELIGAVGNGDSGVVGIVNHEQTPSSAENLFKSLATHGFRVVPMATDDFHGDSVLRKPEIHVAGSDSALMDIIHSTGSKHVSEGWLDAALHGGIEPSSITDSTAQAAFVVDDPVLAQDSTDRRLCNVQPGSDLSLAGEAVSVKRENFSFDGIVPGISCCPSASKLPHDTSRRALDFIPAQTTGFRPITDIDPGQTQCSSEGATTARSLFSELLEANSGTVARDKLINIRKFEWAGHVFDFVTTTGLIVAGGLTVSNCQCYVVGARNPRAASRLGGKIGPAPDDGVGPDGRPNGIDKGWDYQPGATAVERARKSLTEKLDGLPQNIADGLRKTLDDPR